MTRSSLRVGMRRAAPVLTALLLCAGVSPSTAAARPARTTRPAGVSAAQWAALHNPATHARTLAQLVAAGLLPAPRPAAPRPGRGIPVAVQRLDWRALAQCESSGNPRAVSRYGDMGLYQFNQGTWRSVGGRGTPVQAAPSEQTYRAQVLYTRRGARPWPTCGRHLFR